MYSSACACSFFFEFPAVLCCIKRSYEQSTRFGEYNSFPVQELLLHLFSFLMIELVFPDDEVETCTHIVLLGGALIPHRLRVSIGKMKKRLSSQLAILKS